MRRMIEANESLIIAPTLSPVTLNYARAHIRALTTAEDDLVQVWIDAATEYVQEQTNRQIMTAVYELWLDAFPWAGYPSAHRIELPHPPLQSVVSVTYITADGTVAFFDTDDSPTLPLYTTHAPAGPYARRGWIEPNYGLLWPQARVQPASVKIQYVAGYGDVPQDVTPSPAPTTPSLLTGIICYLVGHFDQFRVAVHEARRGQVLELPYGVQAMMDGFKYSAYPSAGSVWRYGPGGLIDGTTIAWRP